MSFATTKHKLPEDILASAGKFNSGLYSESGYIARHNTILRGTVGSSLYGLNLPGSDDLDHMGVCIEPPEFVLGLRNFEQWTYRTQPEGMRSGPGDLDLTIYGLKKYVNLAAKGNPSIMILLFAPDTSLCVTSIEGTQLRDLVPQLASKIAVRKYLGYMTAQYQRLLGERGQMRVHRPELIEKYGYDTKYAMHCLRLGIQGLEFARAGRISLPMPEYERAFLFAVRSGDVSFETVKTKYIELQSDLEDALKNSRLPDEPNWFAINSWLMTTYIRYWNNDPFQKGKVN